MERPRPTLVAVETEGASPSPDSAAPPPASGRFSRLSNLLPAVLALLLLSSLIGLAVQSRRSAALEDRVVQLGTELADTRARLGAFRAHLERVRDGVAGVRAELATLEELVAREPRVAPSGAESP